VITSMGASEKFRREGEIIGRLIVGYGEMELDLCRCIAAGNDDFNSTLKTMFGQRSEGSRIRFAKTEGLKVYSTLGSELAAAFCEAIEAVKFCLQIRNRYAHWQFYNDENYGMLALVNVEELAKSKTVIDDYLSGLTVRHLTKDVLQKQHQYFLYTRACIGFVNCEGRFLRAVLKNRVFERPMKLERPPEYA
jgi:hypothetical protein